ncbi:MAG: DUF1427 family protein [candidate division WOR-3 bacterium]
MKEIVLAFLTGFITGAIFSMAKLPIPAPPTLAGVMGIIGIFLGYVVVRYFVK